MYMYKEICKCRVCGNENLQTIVNLGMQKLTGIFPKKGEDIPEGPLELVKCVARGEEKVCGLVQLRHSCEGNEMYGENYGYRSGLNSSMVHHLKEITDEIKEKITLKQGDMVIDIGSNDSTLLRGYNLEGIDYVGMDPTGNKFRKYYPAYVELVPDFFSAENVFRIREKKKAKVITSIAMFYDLEEPIKFARDICSVLDDEGLWILEQSYLPAMLEANSYDTICQEHLEFYCLAQIEWIVNLAGLKVIDVVENDINGGSFRITVAKKESDYRENENVLKMRSYELEMGYDKLDVFISFKENIEKQKKDVLEFLERAKREGKKVYGYGASTKGNVLLQYCGITSKDIIAIAEVNEDKFGCVTPGTGIPIISEDEAKKDKPDYFMVLPWHFRENILEKEKEYLKESKCAFVFPLPTFEVVQ